MEVLHVFGLCSDTQSHFDLLDLFLVGGATGSIYYFKLHIKVYISLIKDFFTRK